MPHQVEQLNEQVNSQAQTVIKLQDQLIKALAKIDTLMINTAQK